MNSGKRPVDEYYEFLSPEEPIHNHYLADYLKEIQAGLMMGIEACLKKDEFRVLLFGYPGTGKSEYPYVLLNYLRNIGFKYAMLFIRCNRVTSKYSEVNEIKNLLKQLTERINEYEYKMLVFDEFDSISPRRFILPSQRELSLWTMSYLANGMERREKTLIFGITNFPYDIDEAVRDRIQYYIYFNFPDKQAIETILSYYQIPKSDKVGEKIVEFLTKEGFQVTGRGLVFACRKIQNLESDLEKRTEEEIANLILIHAQPVPRSDAENYIQRNSVFIEHAKRNVNYWSQRFMKFSETDSNFSHVIHSKLDFLMKNKKSQSYHEAKIALEEQDSWKSMKEKRN